MPLIFHVYSRLSCLQRFTIRVHDAHVSRYYAPYSSQTIRGYLVTTVNLYHGSHPAFPAMRPHSLDREIVLRQDFWQLVERNCTFLSSVHSFSTLLLICCMCVAFRTALTVHTATSCTSGAGAIRTRFLRPPLCTQQGWLSINGTHQTFVAV